MPFEFDSAKSAANKLKHGIDFEAAQELWEDQNALVVPARDQVGERRFARIAQWKGKIWFCVYTMRGPTIRIITVRRARVYEEEQYGS